MNININNPRLKILLVVLLVILLAVIIITGYIVNQRIKKESQAVPAPIETGQEKPVPLTQEQIEEALSQKVTPEEQDKIKPLTAEEVNDALNQKLPESEVKPLSQEEIQQALNEKVK